MCKISFAVLWSPKIADDDFWMLNDELKMYGSLL